MKSISAKTEGGAQGKAVSGLNAATGGMGIISAHNVCHAVCEGLVGMAAIFGITGIGMPLAFLTDYNIYFWAMAFAFLLIGFALLVSKRCISKNMMMFNGGIVLIGVPFAFLSPILPAFWLAGSGLVLFGVYNCTKSFAFRHAEIFGFRAFAKGKINGRKKFALRNEKKTKRR